MKKRIVVIAIQHPECPNLYLHLLRQDSGRWTAPAGHVIPGETTHEAAARELAEEAGLKVPLAGMHMLRSGEYPDENGEPMEVTLWSAPLPEGQEITGKDDPDAEAVTFKFLDPTSNDNLEVPREHNILVAEIEGIQKSELEKGPKETAWLSSKKSARGLRELLPKMSPQKIKAHLDVLSDPESPSLMTGWLGARNSRISPSGEREILLHRGAGKREHAKFSNSQHYTPDAKTSWSLSWQTANHFGDKARGRTVSAWVPESSIHSIPAAHPDQKYHSEGEFIISPGKYPIHQELDSQTRKPLEIAKLELAKNILVAEISNLTKGSLQRRNPAHSATYQEHIPFSEWQNLEDDYHATDPEARQYREALPEMSPAQKFRAFHRLHGHTQVRRNPSTGEREFLLHRGAGADEIEHVSRGSNTIVHPSRSSWTPKRKTAENFGLGYKGGTMSAWIPESSIVTVPKHVSPSEYDDEHEVVVHPGKYTLTRPPALVPTQGFPSGLGKSEEVDVDAAKEEIGSKPIEQIQLETARKWAARAIASYMLAQQADGSKKELFRRFIDGDEYRHEALEHASLIDDAGKVFLILQKLIDAVRKKVDLSYLDVEGVNKSELTKGMKGDWRKEGYTLEYHPPASFKPGPYALHAFHAKDSNGRTVGHLTAEDTGEGTFLPQLVHVEPEHQRKGLATAMYQAMEAKTGLKAVPDLEAQSPEGAALWRQKKRPFGKSELTKADPVQSEGTFAPNPKIRQQASAYMKQAGLPDVHPTMFAPLDRQNHQRIAHAYSQMQHNPNDPDVKASYDALGRETLAQFQHIKNSGLKLSRMHPGQPNPYPRGAEDLHADVNRGHMWYAPTEGTTASSFGQSDHPMLQPTNEFHEGKRMPLNDVFRIVHDYFGHAKEGVNFSPRGEEHAWRSHSRMYSPLANRALATETRGQASMNAFGPHGHISRHAPEKTTFANQKAGLLPDWALSDTTSSGQVRKGELQKAPNINEDYRTSEPSGWWAHSRQHPSFKHIKTIKSKEGHNIHVSEHDESAAGHGKVTSYAIYDPASGGPKDLTSDPISLLQIHSHDPESGEDLSHVAYTHTARPHRNKGLGSALYRVALKDQGTLASDRRLTEGSHARWQALSKLPGVVTQMGPTQSELPYGSPRAIESRHTARYFRRRLKNPTKLAASELLEKPYVSEAQRRWAHTSEGKEALGGETGVHHWDEATKGKHLPERVQKDEDFGTGAKAHGWIMPNGEYHHMEPDVTHNEPVENSGFASMGDAIHSGWIPIGHAGEANISVSSKTLRQRNSPAMATARKMMAEHHPGKRMSIYEYTKPSDEEEQTIHDDVPVEHFARHGTIPKRSLRGMLNKSMPTTYLENARKGYAVLVPVALNGVKEMAPGLPFHITVKMFKSPQQEMSQDVKERIKHDVTQFVLPRPSASQLMLMPTKFVSPRSGRMVYSLTVKGMPHQFEDLYNHYRDIGVYYGEYSPHISIDEDLYNRITSGKLPIGALKLSVFSPELCEGDRTVYVWSYDPSRPA